jgi:hypothetical protein
LATAGGPAGKHPYQKKKKKINSETDTDGATSKVKLLSGKFLLGNTDIKREAAENFGKAGQSCMNLGNIYWKSRTSFGRESNDPVQLQKAAEQYREAAKWFGEQKVRLIRLGDNNGSVEAEKNRLAAEKEAELLKQKIAKSRTGVFRLSEHPDKPNE